MRALTGTDKWAYEAHSRGGGLHAQDIICMIPSKTEGCVQVLPAAWACRQKRSGAKGL
jgi:hypothetical protein